MNDPEVTRYLMAGRSRQTRASIRDFVRNAGPQAWAILVNGRHVGNIMLRTIDPISHVAEVGILIGERSLWGRGVASAALARLSAQAFVVMGFRKLWAGTCSPACARLFRRQGWQLEGMQRRHVYLSGRWCDHWLFGLMSPCP